MSTDKPSEQGPKGVAEPTVSHDFFSAPPSPPVPVRIGAYVIKRVIASGGMGTVYEALQQSPRRVVAVKVMREGLASKSALRRFEYESQLLARLKHPGIAQIYEAGTHDSGAGGQPYFVMEYIPGARSIIDYVQSRKLPTRDRLELFSRICDAIQYGHSRGIIHRDLKPSNILVDESAGLGQPKIIDFGVARATDSDLALTTLQTDVGQLIGTLQYMSPEQCEADPHDLDTRSDVYSLGVVLYELLCERLPYDVGRLAVYEAARVIREQAPVRPSTLSRTLRGDIETITLKSLEKDRTRRYQSVADLVQDIRRYLSDKPIEARPPSVAYQMRMFARRHRTVFVAVSSVFIILVAALAFSIRAAVIAGRANSQALKDRNAAIDASNNERAQAQVAIRKTKEAEASAAVANEATRRATIAADRAERQAYLAMIAAADAAIRSNDFATASERLKQAPEKYRDWEWRVLNEQMRGVVRTLVGHGGPVESIVFSPDGSHLATVSAGRLTIWDTSTGLERSTRRLADAIILDADFSSIGMRIAVGCSDHSIRLLSAIDDRELLVLRGHTGPVNTISYSPNCKTIVSGSTDGTVRTWSTATGDRVAMWETDGPVSSVVFSPDGMMIGGATLGASVRVWSSTSNELLLDRRCESIVNDLAISPDSKLLAIALDDGTCEVRNIHTDSLLASFHGHSGPVKSVSFARDGSAIATGSSDRTVRLWNPQTASEIDVFHLSASAVTSVVLSPDSKALAMGSGDGTARIAPANRGGPSAYLRGHAGPVRCLAVRSDGAQVASAADDGSVIVWQIPSSQILFRLVESGGYVSALSYTPDGEKLAAGSRDGMVRIWNTATGKVEQRLVGHEAEVAAVSFNSAGDMIATGSWDHSVRLWSTSTGQQLKLMTGHDSLVSSIAFTPDGQYLVSASGDSSVRLWDVRTGEQAKESREHLAEITGLAIVQRDDATLFVTSSLDETLRLWDLQQFRPIAVLNDNEPLLSVASNPSGTRIVTGGQSALVRLWSVDTQEQITSLLGHSGAVRCLAFSRDGLWLVSGSDDQTLRGWGFPN